LAVTPWALRVASGEGAAVWGAEGWVLGFCCLKWSSSCTLPASHEMSTHGEEGGGGGGRGVWYRELGTTIQIGSQTRVADLTWSHRFCADQTDLCTLLQEPTLFVKPRQFPSRREHTNPIGNKQIQCKQPPQQTATYEAEDGVQDPARNVSHPVFSDWTRGDGWKEQEGGGVVPPVTGVAGGVLPSSRFLELSLFSQFSWAILGHAATAPGATT